MKHKFFFCVCLRERERRREGEKERSKRCEPGLPCQMRPQERGVERERERESKLCKHIISPVGNPLNPIIRGSLHRLLEDPRDVSRVVAVDGDLKKEQ